MIEAFVLLLLIVDSVSLALAFHKIAKIEAQITDILIELED